jgi:hyperosmotically inducible protein
MSTHLKPFGTVSLAVLLALSLAACDRQDDARTSGQKLDSAIAKVDQKTNAAESDLKQGAEQARKSTGAAVTQATRATGGAAKSAAVAVADSAITVDIKAQLAADKTLKALDVRVETTAGHVVLRGTVPDLESKVRATRMAAAVKGVVDVDNHLTVVGHS